VLLGTGAVLLTALIVLGNLWADYQPLSWGSTYGGGDGELGADNPLHPPATMIVGTKGHETDLAVSLRNNGRFDVTIDRIEFPLGWLQTVQVDRGGVGPGHPLRFPDRIPAHSEREYTFKVRVNDCFNPGGASSMENLHVFFHALGNAHSAWIPIRGGFVIEGGKTPCPGA